MCQLFYGCVHVINPTLHRTGLSQGMQLGRDRGGNFSLSFSDPTALKYFPYTRLLLRI